MVTEYIKRGQRLGYEDGVLSYKEEIVDLPVEAQEELTLLFEEEEDELIEVGQ